MSNKIMSSKKRARLDGLRRIICPEGRGDEVWTIQALLSTDFKNKGLFPEAAGGARIVLDQIAQGALLMDGAGELYFADDAGAPEDAQRFQQAARKVWADAFIMLLTRPPHGRRVGGRK